MAKTNCHEAVAEFDTYLRVEKNLSERTRRAYAYDLRRFADFLVGIRKRTPNIDEIKAEEIRHYLQKLQMERKYKATTLSRVISTIRVFFDFCVTMKHLDASPAAAFHNPKHPKKLPVFLVESELGKLFAAPDQDADWRGVRDYAFIVTFAFTGLRLQELVGLNIDRMDFERRNLRVFGKGAKERIVPMNERVVDALRRYLMVRPYAETDAVFLNFRMKRLSARGVEKILDQYVIRAGITNRNISPHKLRHTFATLLHHQGVDVLEIQQLLGHAHISSTQIYTHTSDERLVHAVQKLDRLL